MAHFRNYAIPLVLSLMTSGRAIAILSPEDRSLLDAVRTVRQGTLATVPHGRGAAETSLRETWLANNGRVWEKTRPRHRTEFAFAGSDSLRKDYAPDRKNVIYESFLLKGDREARYFSGAEHIPASVSIAPRVGFVWFEPEMTNYCYENLARIPFPAEESQFWQAVGGTTFVASVSREGTVVRLTFGLPPSDHIQLDEHVMEFDLAKGGMITRWSDRRIEKSDDDTFDVSSSGKISWRESSPGLFIPAERHCEFVQKTNGKETKRSQSDVSFSEFSVETVPAEQLALGKMGIPTGTPVVDSILHLQYRYGVGGQYGDDPNQLPATMGDVPPTPQGRAAENPPATSGRTSSNESSAPAPGMTGGRSIPSLRSWIGIGLLIFVVLLVILILILTARAGLWHRNG